jgi:transcriptional repressor NrdR
VKCPFCSHPDDRVIDSRTSAGGDVIRRRRECEACAKRFTTYERIEYVIATVVKKDGRREPFDRNKLVLSMRVALSKRPVAADRIDAIADEIERELALVDAREVDSSSLGERVMASLRHLDEVAYVRFASVYKSFRDIDEFARIAERISAGIASEPAPAGEATMSEEDRGSRA